VEPGRHAILRGWWAQARRSSNLLLGTIFDIIEHRHVAASL
jgi:hypothetical protein